MVWVSTSLTFDSLPTSIYLQAWKHIIKKQDVQVAQAVADIIALNADAQLAQKMGVKPGKAVLLLEEVLFDVEGVAVECSRNYFVPDFFRFHVVRS